MPAPALARDEDQAAGARPGDLQPSPEGLEELPAFEQRLLLADSPQLDRGHVDIVVRCGREGKGVRVAGPASPLRRPAAGDSGRADLGRAGSGPVWTPNGKRILVTVERR